jgi:hypothetical protein
MHPAIQDGDIVRVEPLVRGQVRVGDVVFYLTATGKPVVHRIIGPTWVPGLLIKGDSTSRVDGILPASRVRGRIAAVERGGKVVELMSGRGSYKAVFRSWVRWLAGPALARLQRHRWDLEQPVVTYYTDEENVDND